MFYLYLLHRHIYLTINTGVQRMDADGSNMIPVPNLDGITDAESITLDNHGGYLYT